MGVYEDSDNAKVYDGKSVLIQKSYSAKSTLIAAFDTAMALLSPKKGFDGGFYHGTTDKYGYRVTITVEKI